MILNIDVKSLEVCVAAELASDKVMIDEIVSKQDMHKNNQDSLGLPSRLIAKIFIFRLLFGGSAHAYATDPDFKEVGYSINKWQEVIDLFYKKYSGIAAWHRKIITEAQTTGKLVSPLNGRYFPFEPVQVDGKYVKNRDGSLKWPITQIKNYLIQGGGSDLVMLARLQANKLIREQQLECKLISTVHDSIVASCPEENVEEVGKILMSSVEDIPNIVKQVWGYTMRVPMTAEIQYGKSKGEMHDLVLDKH